MSLLSDTLGIELTNSVRTPKARSAQSLTTVVARTIVLSVLKFVLDSQLLAGSQRKVSYLRTAQRTLMKQDQPTPDMVSDGLLLLFHPGLGPVTKSLLGYLTFFCITEMTGEKCKRYQSFA